MQIATMAALLAALVQAGMGSQHAYVGTYLRGDGIGATTQLTLTKDGRFEATISSDLGSEPRTVGRARVHAGELTLHAEGLPDRLAGAWRSVAWDRRKYLLREDEMLDFVNDVNGGVEPRTSGLGAFFMREGDEGRAAKGRPSLPPPWLKLVLTRELVGRVTELDQSRLKVSLGSRDGVFIGMRLAVQFGDGTGADIEVQEVGPSESWARFKSDRVRLGLTVSSRM